MDTLNLSPVTRTRIYLGCLVTNVLAVVVIGGLTVWEVIDATKGYATVGVLLAGIGILSNGLALGYRPTRGNTEPDDVYVGDVGPTHLAE